MSNSTITDLMPVDSLIRDTPWEEFLNNSIGYFLEVLEADVEALNDGLFIESAEGKYLDLHGKDLGLPRKSGEVDDDYRNRLLVEPLDQFTLEAMYEVYDVQLLSYNANKSDLMLLSDNHLFLMNTSLIVIMDYGRLLSRNSLPVPHCIGGLDGS